MPPFPFLLRDQDGVVLCTGLPTCQAGHDGLLQELDAAVGGQFLPAGTQLNSRRKGNLGEFIALTIGRRVNRVGIEAMPATRDPLKDIAGSDIDIVWIHFDETDPSADHVALQETKTTGDPQMGYASALLDDYDKLFGLAPREQLHVRLQSIKWLFELSGRAELCPRLDGLAGRSPQTSHRVRLVPTVIHELRGSDPVTKLAAIRTSLVAKGWSTHQIEMCSVSLESLHDRLQRLSCGQP